MFVRLPSIEPFDRFATRAEWRRDNGQGDGGRVRTRGKVKLHGAGISYVLRRDAGASMSAVFGRRARELNPAVMAADDFLTSLHGEFEKRNPEDGVITVFGEWAGPGIQKRDAVTRIAQPSFFPFAIGYLRPQDMALVRKMEAGDDEARRAVWRAVRIVTDPEAIAARVPAHDRIRPIPWETPEIAFDFSSEEEVSRSLAAVNAQVGLIGQADPFIERSYGVTAPGEGLVFMPVVRSFDENVTLCDLADLSFKAKTAAHAVRLSSAPATRRMEPPEGIAGFVRDFVTPARCEQILDETMPGGADRSRTRDFIAALREDVLTESGPERDALGRDLGRLLLAAIDRAAAGWFLGRVEHAGPSTEEDDISPQ